MRVMMILTLGAWMLVTAGCAQGTHPAARHEPQAPSRMVQARRASEVSLLFDAAPGWWHASDFAVRSDWPSTDAYYATGQTIFFRERFYDYQGPGIRHQDHTYRRFTSYRTGVGYR